MVRRDALADSYAPLRRARRSPGTRSVVGHQTRPRHNRSPFLSVPVPVSVSISVSVSVIVVVVVFPCTTAFDQRCGRVRSRLSYSRSVDEFSYDERHDGSRVRRTRLISIRSHTPVYRTRTHRFLQTSTHAVLVAIRACQHVRVPSGDQYWSVWWGCTSNTR